MLKLFQIQLSYGAGALFRGDASIHRDLRLNEQWLQTSYLHFNKLANMAAAQAAYNSVSTADQDEISKNSESLASSILSLKSSSTISSVAKNLNDLNIENDQSNLKEFDSVPKLIMEQATDDLKQKTDLTNNNNSSTTNLNLTNLSANNSSNSLSVNTSDKSHSRSPSPCRSNNRSKSPNLKNEIPDHGVRLGKFL